MKTYVMIALGLLLASLSVTGQNLKREEKAEVPVYGTVHSYEPAYLRRAAVNYAVALRSDCDGVVESAIAHSTFLRIFAQRLDMSQIHSELADLVDKGRTSAIRYRAYLATAVFDSPAMFENTVRVKYEDNDQFFSLVASQVHKTLLGHNVQ